MPPTAELGTFRFEVRVPSSYSTLNKTNSALAVGFLRLMSLVLLLQRGNRDEAARGPLVGSDPPLALWWAGFCDEAMTALLTLPQLVAKTQVVDDYSCIGNG